MVAEFEGTKDQDLWKRISADEYRKVAVEECYELFKLILRYVIQGDIESRFASLLMSIPVLDCSEILSKYILKENSLHISVFWTQF